MKTIELMAPAKNKETGMAAINCGADALYIGPAKFGARAAAGNSVKDIAELVKYAHKYHARVYATVNTILYENELEDARDLIIELYNIGIDAVIFQDMALLEMDLPPVPLHASTQCDNYDIEKVKFLDRIGIPRIILARELSIDEIKNIRDAVETELECFVHGALCVSMSGRCYMSAAAGGRSANRGECAQPCRKSYTLKDAGGNVIPAGRYPLSIKDLNRSEYIPELIDAGISSFKIEGRLKDDNYVKNIVAHYRKIIDEHIEKKGDIRAASSGITVPGFTPDPDITFNRGYAGYFMRGRNEKLLSAHTPKSTGKFIGKVSVVENKRFRVDSSVPVSNGDGLFFLKRDKTENGLRVNKVEGGYIYPFEMKGIYKGAEVYKNYDRLFEKQLENATCERKIPVNIVFSETETGFALMMKDRDGFYAEEIVEAKKEVSRTGGDAASQIVKHLSKLGSTIFKAADVDVEISENRFIQVKLLNEMRRRCSAELETKRLNGYTRPHFELKDPGAGYPYKKLDLTWNVSNSLARRFYEKHGVEEIEPALEISGDRGSEPLMTTRMCLKYELDMCFKHGGEPGNYSEPFILDDSSRSYCLSFECDGCVMLVKGAQINF